jgi:asparagine synthase (glutamine-hydrolysing)
MTAIAGIYYWDARAIDEIDLTRLAFRHRLAAPNGSGTVTPAAGVALHAHVLRFDRLSASERQPHVFARQSVLTWDGRLDNRDDLLMSFRRSLGDDRSDVALVAQAYARWGLDCLPRLIGDWSLACWDFARQALVLARDPMGNRPLYYHEMPEGIAWATSLDALADCFDLYSHPDDDYIAGTLTLGAPPELTPFRSTRAVRAGHVVIASRNLRVSVRRYWQFAPDTIKYKDPRNYAERLRELICDAVRVRLRAERTVWAHLSGGWDSSSVVCVANDLLHNGTVEAPGIQPVTLLTSSSAESDERQYVEAVERWCGVSSVKCEFGGYPTFDELLQHRRPFPRIPRLSIESPARDAGDRIILTGSFGDLIMGKTGAWRYSMLEPLYDLDVLQFFRLCFARTQKRRYPLAGTFTHLALAALLPIGVQGRIGLRDSYSERARKLHVSSRDLAKVFGVTPALLARAPRPRVLHGPSVSDFPVAKQALVNALYYMADHVTPQNVDQMPEVWLTSPYVHRPLIEYVLAVPGLALWDPLHARAGMKRALIDVLPPELLSRATKGNPNAVLARAHRDRVADLDAHGLLTGPPTTWRLVARGDLDSASLTHALRDATTSTVPVWSSLLTTCVPIEAWLRAMESHSSCSKSSPHCPDVLDTRLLARAGSA